LINRTEEVNELNNHNTLTQAAGALNLKNKLKNKQLKMK
jgi:hypothetical protein